MIFSLFCLNFLPFPCGVAYAQDLISKKKLFFCMRKKINPIELEYMYTGVYKQFNFTILCVEFHIVL